jgi:hypothetical protein
MEGSRDSLRASIMRPGYFFPSSRPKHTLGMRSISASAGLACAWRISSSVQLPIFYPGWLISVEESVRFAFEFARGRWKGKGSPIFENTGIKKLVKGPMILKPFSSSYRRHVSSAGFCRFPVQAGQSVRLQRNQMISQWTRYDRKKIRDQ